MLNAASLEISWK